ncbi:MAG: T9SS type A sorting domain-containing protein, partial [candidate division Zixibacteria bacterium]|nr:T9SS type A sorting domain-containing protein [candidate division Zixibacteria bacterium]
GSFYLPVGRLGHPAVYADKLPVDKFFCYPNPTLSGRTTIRCFLGANANVTLTMYDLSGKRVDEIKMYGQQGTIEKEWNGSRLPTGVYRCYIKADFGGEIRSAFIDIAIVK